MATERKASNEMCVLSRFRIALEREYMVMYAEETRVRRTKNFELLRPVVVHWLACYSGERRGVSVLNMKQVWLVDLSAHTSDILGASRHNGAIRD